MAREQDAFYERNWTPRQIRQWQLDAFNRQWEQLRLEVPYFRRMHNARRLPDAFATWDEFRVLMPTMDRKHIQTRLESLTRRCKSRSQWRSTGGSTAEPIRVPVWECESEIAAGDLWYARSWFDVSPDNRLFLIWGHSHLLGSGIMGWLNGTKRRVQDALLGYHRFSAYDLSEQRLEEAAEALLAFRPAYVLGYAVALDRFARVNQSRQAAFHRLSLKVAIATAESFPRPDSAEIVEEVLGCPVAMEYGAVETGPIAHQRPAGFFEAFWRHHFVEGMASEHMPGASEVLITSLYPRCLPLVRYRIGDLISGDPNDDTFDQRFENVIGRCNDYVVLEGGTVIHSEAFSHSVKDCSQILNYQVVQGADRSIVLRYVAERPLDTVGLTEIRRRLGRIHPRLADIAVEHSHALETTVAGKVRRVARVAEAGA